MSENASGPVPNIPGYRIESRIGGGQSSVVYRAVQLSMNRPVAVKILLVDLGSEADRRRFERERQLLSTLSMHRSVVDAYDAGVTPEGRPFFVMRLYAENLTQQVVQTGPLTTAHAARVITDVASALDAAHRLGAIHRDVNPNNILLTDDGDTALADFGIAAILGPSGSTNTFAYTPAYSAPEAITSNSYSVASDVFSLAATAFYLLTGERPGSGHDATIGRGLPASVRLVLASGMSPAPGDRPRSAGDFARALMAAVLEGHPSTPVDENVHLSALSAVPPLSTRALDTAPPDPLESPTVVHRDVTPGGAGTAEPGPATAAPATSRRRTGVALAVAALVVALIATAGFIGLRNTGDSDDGSKVAAAEPASTPTPTPDATGTDSAENPVTAPGSCPTGHDAGLRIVDPLDEEPYATVPRDTYIKVAGQLPKGCHVRVFLWAPLPRVAFAAEEATLDPATGQWVSYMETGRDQGDNGGMFIFYAVVLDDRLNGKLDRGLAAHAATGYSIPQWRANFSKRVVDTVKVTLKY